MQVGLTALFTMQPAEPFPALSGTIPENAVKPSVGMVIPIAGRTVDGGFVDSAVSRLTKK